jgi:hypothetical protein
MPDKWIENLRPFPTPPPDVAQLIEARKGSRTEKFDRVMVSLDAAIASIEDAGEEEYARYINTELLPFLLAEQKRAAAEEGLIPLLEWEESLLPQY